MDDIVLNLVVFVILTIIGGGVFLFVRNRQAQNAARMIQDVEQRGWQCVPLKGSNISGFHYSGNTSGIDWDAEASATTGYRDVGGEMKSNITKSTTWSSEEGALDSGLVMIGPRSGGGALPNLKYDGLMGTLIQAGLRLMLGEDADQVDGLSEVPITGPLSNRYMVWAHNPALAHRLLNPPVVSALAAWPQDRLVVKYSPRGILITIQDRQITDINQLEALVNLGVHLAHSRQNA